jgi:hypothetical protein
MACRGVQDALTSIGGYREGCDLQRAVHGWRQAASAIMFAREAAAAAEAANRRAAAAAAAVEEAERRAEKPMVYA